VTATHTFFRRPRLRPGVQITRADAGFALTYRSQSADLDVPDFAAAEVAELLEGLMAGAPSTQLRERAPNLSDFDGMLDELDRLGLLTEDERPAPATMTGEQLYRLVRRFTRRLQATSAGSELFTRMTNGTATRNQLIGYALEYHHVVWQSPALIAPALAHAWHPDAYGILQNFLRDEIGHDRMTRSALAAVGVPGPVLASTQPLPATFAVCATLGAVAAQDPLAFAACLSVVEEPSPQFNRAFAERARSLELPAEFIQPLLDHSDVNADAGHADVSLALLSTTSALGLEHAQAVLKQVAALVESLSRLERDILLHYAGPELALRIFEPDAE
jgi:hypothetical protein